MMRGYTWVGVLFLFLSLANMSVADQIQKEFACRLEPGEASRVWDCLVDFPVTPPNRFIGRDFTLECPESPTSIEVSDEELSETRYTAKVRLTRPADSRGTITGKLDVKIYLGTRSPDDAPAPPFIVQWRVGKQSSFFWQGLSDRGKEKPVSARYAHYIIKDIDSDVVLYRGSVPVHQMGFQVSGGWVLDKKKSYSLEVSLSNISGKRSAPTTARLVRREGEGK